MLIKLYFAILIFIFILLAYYIRAEVMVSEQEWEYWKNRLSTCATGLVFISALIIITFAPFLQKPDD